MADNKTKLTNYQLIILELLEECRDMLLRPSPDLDNVRIIENYESCLIDSKVKPEDLFKARNKVLSGAFFPKPFDLIEAAAHHRDKRESDELTALNLLRQRAARGDVEANIELEKMGE